jgi:hypothetical protein
LNVAKKTHCIYDMGRVSYNDDALARRPAYCYVKVFFEEKDGFIMLVSIDVYIVNHHFLYAFIAFST